MSEDEITPIEDDIIKMSSSEERGIGEIVKLLLDNQFKRRKTILSNRQVPTITTIGVLADLYDVEFLKKWVSDYGEWRTSGDGGKGRQDIVDITKFNYQKQDEFRTEMMNSLKRGR